MAAVEYLISVRYRVPSVGVEGRMSGSGFRVAGLAGYPQKKETAVRLPLFFSTGVISS